MSTYQDIYINHVEDGTFRHHLSMEESILTRTDSYWGYAETLCNIDLDSILKAPDFDINWFLEHERDDVIACHDCLEKFTELFSKNE